MNISVVNYDLTMGGTDRVAYELSLIFRNHGHNVTFITLKKQCKDFFKLPDDILRKDLGFQADDVSVKGHGYLRVGAFLALFRLIRFLRNRRPDLVVSNWTSVNCFVILASFFSKTKVVCIEHIHFDQPSTLWQLLRKLLYKHAFRVVCLTEKDFKKLSAIGSKVVKIYNPVTVKVKALAARKSRKNFLAVGRLEEQKGFDILIRAFARVVKKYPEAKLNIYGSGTKKEELISLVLHNDLAANICLCGPTEDISKAYTSSDYFVLSSRYEGFGLVLVEAQAHGVPVISFDCPNGPSEIIDNRVNGLLVENGSEERLAEAMCELLRDTYLCEKLVENGFRTINRFSHEAIYSMWKEEVFDKI